MFKKTNPFAKVILAAATSLPLLTGLTPQAEADILDGLTAYWNFNDGSFSDVSGNGFEGTGRGTGAIAVTDSKTGFGKAVKLDGSQFIEITGNAPDDLAFAGGSMTVAGWFKVDAFDKEWQALIAKGEGNSWRVARRTTEQSLAIAGGLTDTGTTGINVGDGEWHHFAAIVDLAAGTSIWLDGVKAPGSVAGTPALAANGRRVNIGENPDAVGRQFKGEVDDMAIWNRPLNEEEITTLYNGGAGTPLNMLFPVQIEILGVGTASLLGGDATDPENDGVDAPGAASDPSWNWAGITSSHEPNFNSSEAAFNIFDNKVGGGDDKWCCDDPKPGAPVWVAVQFPNPISLTHFTITSGNDTPGRDPVDFAIQGSDDGANYTDIYHMTPTTNPTVPWTDRNQVVKFTLPFASQPYRFIRYIAYETPADLHQINEIEYFGTYGGSAVSFVSGIRSDITTFSFRLNDSDPSLVDPTTVKLVLDGAEIALGDVTKVDGKIDVTVTPASQFLPNSVHTYVITAKDSLGNNIKAEGSFTTLAYAYLRSGDSVTPDTSRPGFIWNVHQNNDFTANDNVRPVQQLAGLLGVNFANPEAQGIAIAPGTPGAGPNDPIMFEIEGVLNLDQTAGANGFFNPNDQMPGIPGTADGPTDGIAAEIIYYVELPAGATRMIVNSDDGFRTSAGAINDVFRSQLAGEFSGGRGAGDTEFVVYAETAGVYAFRTIWEEGGGGANIELVTLKEDGTKVLLNDIANGGLPAYRAVVEGTAKSAITLVNPVPGATGVFFDTSINLSITDGTDAVDASSVKLSLDGTLTSAVATKANGVTTLAFQPAAVFTPGVHTASITFTAGGTSRTESWTFTVAPFVTLTTAEQAVSVDKTAPGFNWDVFENGSFTHTSLLQTEQALAGTLTSGTGELLPNLADPTKPNIAIGEGTPGKNGLVHFEIEGVLNLSQNAGDNNGNFTPDDGMPGIPGTDGQNNGIDAEIITFVELPAGGITLGVNSDDGFRTQAGYINVPADGLILGQFDGGRGASDTLFRFFVKDAGVYPLRTIWNEGGGGANIEIFSVKADGSKVLLNDIANGGLPTYRKGVAPSKAGSAPTISVVRNANGSITVTWEGELHVATKPEGPYTKLEGVTSPLTLNPDQQAQFARAVKP